MAEGAEYLAACAVVGVEPYSTVRQIKAAYRERATLLHPDVHHGGGDVRVGAATVAMRQLNEAYRIIVEAAEDASRTMTESNGSREPWTTVAADEPSRPQPSF